MVIYIYIYIYLYYLFDKYIKELLVTKIKLYCIVILKFSFYTVNRTILNFSKS